MDQQWFVDSKQRASFSSEIVYRANHVIRRPAKGFAHIQYLVSKEAITLFFTGPKIRTWGFYSFPDRKFVPYTEYLPKEKQVDV